MTSVASQENRKALPPDGLEGFFQIVLPMLDERQRRLVAGAAAQMLSGGSIARVAQAAGMSRSTVVGGIEEIAKGASHSGRVRAPGAGRKKVIESQPGLLAALDASIEPIGPAGVASPLRWTDKSAAKLAEELVMRGFHVSPDTVGRLLKASGFFPRATAGTTWAEGAVAAQFRYIADEAAARLAAGEPVVSARISKKLGTVQPDAAEVPHPSVEVANGIYELGGAEGWMTVGEDEDAAALAGQAIQRWWQTMGIDRHPAATRLMIIPCVGAHTRPSPAWTAAFRRLAVQIGLELTVCHHPPGMMRWTKLEHRLFSFVTDNRPDHPLISYRTIVELGAGTSGALLKERAELEEGAGARPPSADYSGSSVHPDIEALASAEVCEDDRNYVVRPRGLIRRVAQGEGAVLAVD